VRSARGLKADLIDNGSAAEQYRFDFICYDPASGASLGRVSSAPNVSAALDGYDWSTVRRFVHGDGTPPPSS
jgi:hypothetical protein